LAIRPTSSAPTSAPVVEPRPPMISTMKISTLTCAPICGTTFCWYRPHITPPRPASALPTTNTPMNSTRMR
jgi:hypothetical protein